MENVLLPATSSSMTGLAVGQSWCGVAYLWGGRTALHVLARGSLTAIRYQEEILRPLGRPYAGAVGPRFLLMLDLMWLECVSSTCKRKALMLWTGPLAPSTYAMLHHRLSRSWRML